MSPDRHARTMLPIPDRPAPGLTTYDAKDPDTAFPPIEPLLPPGARRTCWSCCWTTWVSVRRARSVARADADGGPAGCGRAAVQPVPHDGAVRADAAGDADRSQPPLGRDGQHHRDRDLGPGNSSVRPNTKAPLAMTLKLNGYSTAQFGSATRCRSGSRRRWVRSTPGRQAAVGSRRSTASSAGRTTSRTRLCTTARPRWSRPRPPRRGTT